MYGMSLQYGELRPTNGWDRLAGLGHPIILQRVSRLGSVTARQSSSGRQPNFAALNRGRHLCSAGRPSRWALAHILVLSLCLFLSLSVLVLCDIVNILSSWWVLLPVHSVTMCRDISMILLFTHALVQLPSATSFFLWLRPNYNCMVTTMLNNWNHSGNWKRRTLSTAT